MEKNPDALPPHATPADVRTSYATDATAVGNEGPVDKYGKAAGYGNTAGYGHTAGYGNSNARAHGHQAGGVMHGANGYQATSTTHVPHQGYVGNTVGNTNGTF